VLSRRLRLCAEGVGDSQITVPDPLRAQALSGFARTSREHGRYTPGIMLVGKGIISGDWTLADSWGGEGRPGIVPQPFPLQPLTA